MSSDRVSSTARTAGLGAACGLVIAGCLRFAAFGCTEDAQCDLEEMGVCVSAAGACAYPDAACLESGLRFDAAAGGGLGGQCVEPSVAGTETDDPTVGAGPDTDATTDDPASGPMTTMSVDTDPSTTGDTAGVCGGAGQACCPGDDCDAGLTCMGNGCGCVTALAAGARHTCAIKLDGSVWCWGANDFGQLGMLGTQMQTSPVAVPAQFGAGMGAEAIAAREHTCVVRANDVAMCWGQNTSGKADPLVADANIEPTLATWATNATAVGVGPNHTCVGRTMDISTTCWGDNGSGQLTGSEAGPGPVEAMAGFEVNRFVLGVSHTCASTLMGEVFCWGGNASGQLALDPVATPSSDAPLPVDIPPIGEIAGGDHHVCVRVGTDAWCWGRNEYGQLGDGTGVESFTPVMVALPNRANAVTGVVSGPNHACAITAGGELWCWGRNDHGQLMLRPDKMGNDQYTLTPVMMQVGATVLEVATGSTQMCALTDEGTVLCWGRNHFGQNGNGTTDYGFDPTPAQIECP